MPRNCNCTAWLTRGSFREFQTIMTETCELRADLDEEALRAASDESRWTSRMMNACASLSWWLPAVAQRLQRLAAATGVDAGVERAMGIAVNLLVICAVIPSAVMAFAIVEFLTALRGLAQLYVHCRTRLGMCGTVQVLLLFIANPVLLPWCWHPPKLWIPPCGHVRWFGGIHQAGSCRPYYIGL